MLPVAAHRPQRSPGAAEEASAGNRRPRRKAARGPGVVATNPGAPMNFLDKVHLAYSCPLAWEKLVGGERRRFCGDCQKHVTNLSAMTRPAAEAWVARNQGVSACMRVEVDAQGRALHRPAVGAAALAALSLAAAGCANDEGYDSGSSSRVGTPTIAEVSADRSMVPGGKTDRDDPSGSARAFRNAGKEHAASVKALSTPVMMGEMPAAPEPPRVLMGVPTPTDYPGPTVAMGRMPAPSPPE